MCCLITFRFCTSGSWQADHFLVFPIVHVSAFFAIFHLRVFDQNTTPWIKYFSLAIWT